MAEESSGPEVKEGFGVFFVSVDDRANWEPIDAGLVPAWVKDDTEIMGNLHNGECVASKIMPTTWYALMKIEGKKEGETLQ